jgi:hypothetical protein
VLAMPNSLRTVFFKGPREPSVQFEPRGNRTTQRSAIHLYVQGTLKATVSASTRTWIRCQQEFEFLEQKGILYNPSPFSLARWQHLTSPPRHCESFGQGLVRGTSS